MGLNKYKLTDNLSSLPGVGPKIEKLFEGINVKNIHKLELLSKTLFANRRKKLKNKIKQLFDDRVIEANKLDQYFDLRAENISKENFYQLAKLLKD